MPASAKVSHIAPVIALDMVPNTAPVPEKISLFAAHDTASVAVSDIDPVLIHNNARRKEILLRKKESLIERLKV